MALSSTIYRFNLDISDVDEGFYDSLELRVAMHPSEAVPYLLTRVLIWSLNQQEGLTLAKGGLSQSIDPPVYVDDLTGTRTHWFEIGHPSADRLHKASKAADIVKVYVHKPLSPWLEQVRAKAIHRAEQIELVEVEPSFLASLGGSLARNNAWALVRSEGALYVTVGETTFESSLRSHWLKE